MIKVYLNSLLHIKLILNIYRRKAGIEASVSSYLSTLSHWKISRPLCHQRFYKAFIIASKQMHLINIPYVILLCICGEIRMKQDVFRSLSIW